MKKINFLCFFLPFISFAYNINVKVKYPFETTRELIDSVGTIVIQKDSLSRGTYIKATLYRKDGMISQKTVRTDDSGIAVLSFDKWEDGREVILEDITKLDVNLPYVKLIDAKGRVISEGLLFNNVAFKKVNGETLSFTLPENSVQDNPVTIGSGSHSFKFVIMTDIHIGDGGWNFEAGGYDDPWQGTYGDLDGSGAITDNTLRVLDVRNYIRGLNGINFVVASGDLTDSAERGELECVRRLVLDSLNFPFVPMLGNHDTWAYYYVGFRNPEGEDRNTAPAGGFFKRYGFGDYYDSLKYVLPFGHWSESYYLRHLYLYYHPGSGPFCTYFFDFSFDYQNYHFICGDFNTRHQASLGWGGSDPGTSVYSPHWKWFFQEVDKALNENREIVIISHHPFDHAHATNFGNDQICAMEDSLDLRGINYLKWWFGGHQHSEYEITTLCNNDTTVKRVISVGATKDKWCKTVTVKTDYFLDFTKNINPLSDGMTYKFIGTINGGRGVIPSTYTFNFGDGYSSGGSSESMIKSHKYASSNIRKVTLDAVINNSHYTIAHMLIVPDIKVNSPVKNTVLEPGSHPVFSLYMKDPVSNSHFDSVSVKYRIGGGTYQPVYTIKNSSHLNPYQPSYSGWTVPGVFSSNDTFRVEFFSHAGYSRILKVPFRIGLTPPTNLTAWITSHNPPVVHIIWSDNSQIETKYVLVRADVGDTTAGPGHWPWSIPLPANTTSFIDSSITETNKNYYYEVTCYVIVDGIKHWSAYSNSDTVYFDTKAPSVSITNPSNNAVLYTGNNTISWDATDEGGIASETLYYPYNQKVVLSGDVRSRSVNLTCRDKGGEYNLKAIAVDYAGNKGTNSKTIVVVDKSKADINLSYTLSSNNDVTINSDILVNRLYSKHSNDVWKIIYDQEDHPKKTFTDPDPLDGENESATYFACRYNSSAMDSFYHTSKKITAAKPVQCPLLYVYTDSGYVLDNSLLPRSEYIREDYLDRYRLNIRPISNNGILRFMITDNEDITYIDQIRLLIVDHLRWIKVGVLPDGRIIPYTETDNPFRAVDNRGIDYTDSVRTRGKGQWRGERNGWLLVNTSSEDTGYVITRAEEPKIPVEATGLNIYTRSNPEDIIIPYQDSLIKYTPAESIVGIDYISIVDRKRNTPLRERYAEIDSLPDEAIYNDNIYYLINPGDTLYFGFKNPGKSAWLKRDYILLTKGYYTGSKENPPLSMGARVIYKNDTRIIQSLGGSIIIEFESKRERDIRLRIYDIAGRLHRDKKITLSMGIKRYSIDNLPQGIYFIKVNKRIYKGVIVR